VLGGVTDPIHDLAAGYKCRDEIATAKASLLRHRKRRCEQRR
jgi:hypothetical protein